MSSSAMEKLKNLTLDLATYSFGYFHNINLYFDFPILYILSKS